MGIDSERLQQQDWALKHYLSPLEAQLLASISVRIEVKIEWPSWHWCLRPAPLCFTEAKHKLMNITALRRGPPLYLADSGKNTATGAPADHHTRDALDPLLLVLWNSPLFQGTKGGVTREQGCQGQGPLAQGSQHRAFGQGLLEQDCQGTPHTTP